jgi:oligopeptide transport system permease protein
MLNYVIKRIAIAIPTMLILIILSFLLMHAAPGGPFTSERPLPPQVLANIEAKYGLDQPLWRQMVNYVWSVVTQFDFGPSFKYKDRTVNEIIGQGFPITLKYGFWSFVFAIGVGIPLGAIAAIRKNTWIDYLAVGISIGAQVLPNFVMAPLLVITFTLWLGWLPGGGWNGGEWQYLIMPVIALSTSYMASIARITRSSMLEVLNSNFIRTAKAKGLPPRTILMRHALKPSLLPVISYLGPAFVGLITGSVVIDIYFSTGGMGYFFVNSATNRDYSVMMGITILVGFLTIMFSLVVDLLYAWIDPKIRY